VNFAKLAALAVAGAALGWNSIDATAAYRLDAPRPAALRDAGVRDADLERLFWMCDHAATTRMLDANERAACTTVGEQFKTEKFGGDFEQMLNWWRKNKAVQHQKLDQDAASNAAQ
jgi:hypothetical protein